MNQTPIPLPLIDRLTNVKQSFLSFNQLQQAIALNLENILNTRAAHYHPLDSPLLTYGSPDFMSIIYGSDHHQNTLCQHLTHIIQQYEPRLSQIQVHLQQIQAYDRILRLIITGHIRIQQQCTKVIFESNLDTQQQTFTIN